MLTLVARFQPLSRVWLLWSLTGLFLSITNLKYKKVTPNDVLLYHPAILGYGHIFFIFISAYCAQYDNYKLKFKKEKIVLTPHVNN